MDFHTDLPELDDRQFKTQALAKRESAVALLQTHIHNRREAHRESLMLACIDTTDLPEETRMEIEERETRLHDYCSLVRWETVPGLIAIIRRIDQMLYESVDATARH